ncbi:8-oxo-dGTP diphosphatase [Streptomyces fildesensis]|uniref:Oxidized purine nucleoside triphosphate hydrolase n=1 Tax=Streptomyces fildesensis TaxID=375757 RepID=A0ABW8CBH9_9ACTN
MSLTSMCLCYLTRVSDAAGPEVLLGVKKTGFGAGKLVGLGGHVEPGESPLQAVVREVMEESSIRVEPAQLRELGVVTFRFPARPGWDSVVSVFGSDRFSGEAEESDEIAPEWFPFDDLPLARMWDDARLWLPRVLAGEYVTAEISFAEDCETVSGARFGEDAA